MPLIHHCECPRLIHSVWKKMFSFLFLCFHLLLTMKVRFKRANCHLRIISKQYLLLLNVQMKVFFSVKLWNHFYWSMFVGTQHFPGKLGTKFHSMRVRDIFNRYLTNALIYVRGDVISWARVTYESHECRYPN